MFHIMYFLQIILKLSPIKVEDLKLGLFATISIKNCPMVLHKSTKGLFKILIYHDFLQGCDDLIEL